MSTTTLSGNLPPTSTHEEKSAASALEQTDHPLFTAAELEQFQEDDAAAGRTLGRILCGGFVFTVLASGAAGFWTMWHQATSDIRIVVVIPAILVITCCISMGWGKAMIDYGAEHNED